MLEGDHNHSTTFATWKEGLGKVTKGVYGLSDSTSTVNTSASTKPSRTKKSDSFKMRRSQSPTEDVAAMPAQKKPYSRVKSRIDCWRNQGSNKPIEASKEAELQEKPLSARALSQGSTMASRQKSRSSNSGGNISKRKGKVLDKASSKAEPRRQSRTLSSEVTNDIIVNQELSDTFARAIAESPLPVLPAKNDCSIPEGDVLVLEQDRASLSPARKFNFSASISPISVYHSMHNSTMGSTEKAVVAGFSPVRVGSGSSGVESPAGVASDGTRGGSGDTSEEGAGWFRTPGPSGDGAVPATPLTSPPTVKRSLSQISVTASPGSPNRPEEVIKRKLNQLRDLAGQRETALVSELERSRGTCRGQTETIRELESELCTAHNQVEALQNQLSVLQEKYDLVTEKLRVEDVVSKVCLNKIYRDSQRELDVLHTTVESVSSGSPLATRSVALTETGDMWARLSEEKAAVRQLRSREAEHEETIRELKDELESAYMQMEIRASSNQTAKASLAKAMDAQTKQFMALQDSLAFHHAAEAERAAELEKARAELNRIRAGTEQGDKDGPGTGEHEAAESFDEDDFEDEDEDDLNELSEQLQAHLQRISNRPVISKAIAGSDRDTMTVSSVENEDNEIVTLLGGRGDRSGRTETPEATERASSSSEIEKVSSVNAGAHGCKACRDYADYRGEVEKFHPLRAKVRELEEQLSMAESELATRKARSADATAAYEKERQSVDAMRKAHEKDLAAAEAKVHLLESETFRLEEEWRTRMEGLEGTIEQLRVGAAGESEQSAEQRKALEARVAELEADAKAKADDVTTATDEMDRLTSELEDLRSRVKTFDEKMNEQRAEYDQMEASYSEALRQVSEREVELVSVKHQHKLQMSAQKAIMAAAVCNQHTLEAWVPAMERRLFDALGMDEDEASEGAFNKSMLKDESLDCSDAFKRGVDAVEALKSNLSEAKVDSSRLRREMDGLRRDIGVAHEREKEIEKDLIAARADAAEKSRRLAEANTRLEAETGRLNDTRKDLELARREVAEKDGDVTRVERVRKDWEAQLRKVEKTLESREGELEEIRGQLAAAEQTVMNLTEEKAALSKAIRDREDRLLQTESVTAKMVKANEEMLDRIKELEQELESERDLQSTRGPAVIGAFGGGSLMRFPFMSMGAGAAARPGVQGGLPEGLRLDMPFPLGGK